MNMLCKDSGKAKDLGLLLLRVGIGLIFINHGYSKLMGGHEKWLWLGSKMSHLGITPAPVFWGFMAAASEFIGGIMLVLGLGTRIAAFFMACVMAVAVVMHISQGDGFSGAAHALSLLVVFLSLLISGGGAYSMEHMFCKKK